MKKIESTIANTLLDRHGDKLSLESLHTLVNGINESYIPINFQHDPRYPPLGRFTFAEVKKRDDNEYEVFGVGEIFENSDEIPDFDNSRSIPVSNFDSNLLTLHYDRNFENDEDIQVINEIEEILGSTAGYKIKKSLDPLSILEITGAFIAGGIASGFMGKIGSDLWDAFIKNIKLLMLRDKPEEEERLLSFEIKIEKKGNIVYIETLLTNPSDKDIDVFFNEGIKLIDKFSEKKFDQENQVSKIVLEYNNEELKILYAVRKDGIPMSEIRSTKDEE